MSRQNPDVIDLIEAYGIAQRLMLDEPETFKSGYTPENAVVAVHDVYNLSIVDTVRLALAIGSTLTRNEGRDVLVRVRRLEREAELNALLSHADDPEEMS